MTKISNWVAASVAAGLIAAGCTVTTGDDLDGGGSGSGGSAGTGGSAGSIITADAGDADVVVTGDAATEAAVVTSACETCIQGNCSTELNACRADTVNGCAESLPAFLSCLRDSTSSDTAAECNGTFTGDAQHPSSDAGNGLVGAGLANDLGSCVMNTPCIDRCRSTDGG